MKNTIKLKFLAFSIGILASLTAGCAHSVHQYFVGDAYPSKKEIKSSRVVNSYGEQFVILSFAFNTDYADEAYRKLLSTCPQGELVGINARSSTSMGFLSYTNKMQLEALCID